MKTYNISITEVLKTTVETQAETLEEAIRTVKDQYRDRKSISPLSTNVVTRLSLMLMTYTRSKTN